MNHRTALDHDHMDTTTYRQAWEEWLKKQNFGLFVTLNRDTTPAGEANAIKACNDTHFHTFPHPYQISPSQSHSLPLFTN
jgi:hypothetical protein